MTDIDIFVRTIPTVFTTLPNGVEIKINDLAKRIYVITEEEDFFFDFYKDDAIEIGIYQYILEEIKESSQPIDCTICEYEDFIRVYLNDSVESLLGKICSYLEDEEKSTLNLFAAVR